jgi:hypothetical protein
MPLLASKREQQILAGRNSAESAILRCSAGATPAGVTRQRLRGVPAARDDGDIVATAPSWTTMAEVRPGQRRYSIGTVCGLILPA